MTERQALNLAILVMKGKYPNIRDVTWDANTYKILNNRTPAAVRAYAQYRELAEALAILEGIFTKDKPF